VKMTSNETLRAFILVWLSYWLLWLLLPFESLYPGVSEAFGLQAAFVLLVILGFSFFGLWGRVPVYGDIFSAISWRYVLWGPLILSFVGLCFLMFDRVYYQGINYTQGVAVAREAWREAGEARGGGVSSAFSLLGNLLSNAYFLPMMYLIVSGNRVPRGVRNMALCVVFVLLFGTSALSGGRSNILLILIFSVAASFSVQSFRLSDLAPGIQKKMLLLFLVLSAIVYVVYVFSARADATGVDSRKYLEGFLPWLGLKLSCSDCLGGGAIEQLNSLFLLVAGYLVHSFSTTAAVVDNGPGEGAVFMIYPLNILFKFGLIGRPNTDWLMAGRFPSLPTVFYYQFGLVGGGVASFLLGFLAGVARYLYVFNSNSVIWFFLFVTFSSVLMCSPLLLVTEFMGYPSVFFTFLVFAFLNRVLLLRF